MHRALLFPEIIAEIIGHKRSDTKFLKTCLLINALFFRSAAHILWHTCGICPAEENKNPAHPRIRHLLEITKRNVERGQFYANYVKILRFKEDLHYQHVLNTYDLDWPNLEELEVVKDNRCNNVFQYQTRLDMIQPYLLPQLRRLTLSGDITVGDELLQMLTERCAALTSFGLKVTVANETHLHGILKDGVSQDGLVGFLEICKLRCMDVRGELKPRQWPLWHHKGIYKEPLMWKLSWGHEVWAALSRQSDLIHLSVDDLDDSTIESLANIQEVSGDRLFPALKSLQTGLSPTGLRHLHRLKPHLSTLALDLRRFPTYPGGIDECIPNMLHISVFSQLSNLEIRFAEHGYGRGRIHGTHLVHLAQSCPSLSRLSIAQNQAQGHQPYSRYLGDSHIEDFARNAPNLKELGLLFRYHATWDEFEMGISEKALESLSRHCVHLKRLWITCDPEWHKLTRPDVQRTALFPNVWDLRIEGPEGQDKDDIEEHHGEDLRGMATSFVARCPRLSEFKFVDKGDYEEYPWSLTVREIIRLRDEEIDREGYWRTPSVWKCHTCKERGKTCCQHHRALSQRDSNDETV